MKWAKTLQVDFSVRKSSASTVVLGCRGSVEAGMGVRACEHVVNSADCCSHSDADVFIKVLARKCLALQVDLLSCVKLNAISYSQ